MSLLQSRGATTDIRPNALTFDRKLTAKEYAALVRRVDGRTQRVYESAEPCACSPRASSPEAA
jgi:hypothetical protein